MVPPTVAASRSAHGSLRAAGFGASQSVCAAVAGLQRRCAHPGLQACPHHPPRAPRHWARPPRAARPLDTRGGRARGRGGVRFGYCCSALPGGNPLPQPHPAASMIAASSAELSHSPNPTRQPLSKLAGAQLESRLVGDRLSAAEARVGRRHQRTKPSACSGCSAAGVGQLSSQRPRTACAGERACSSPTGPSAWAAVMALSPAAARTSEVSRPGCP